MILVLVPYNNRKKLRGELLTGLGRSKIERCKITQTSAIL